MEEETIESKVRERLMVEISSCAMDRMAIDWIKKLDMTQEIASPRARSYPRVVEYSSSSNSDGIRLKHHSQRILP